MANVVEKFVKDAFLAIGAVEADVDSLDQSLVQDLCQDFAQSEDQTAIFLCSEHPEGKKNLSISWKAHRQPGTDKVVAIVKNPGIVEGIDDLESVLVLQGQQNYFQKLQGVLKYGVGTYFDTFCKTIDNELEDNLSSARRKITELELLFQNLQQGSEIPHTHLSIHPIVEQLLSSHDLDESALAADLKFANELQDYVVRWGRAIQKITFLDRDIMAGTAEQEIKFWPSMEHALRGIELQLQNPGVRKTMELLNEAKRFQAVIGFETDTGLKSVLEKVSKYSFLMRDFPLQAVVGAQSLPELSLAVESVFAHLSKRLRNTTYPIERCSTLVELISQDVETAMRRILAPELIMDLSMHSFEKMMDEFKKVLRNWDDGSREYVRIARELKIKRSDTHGVVSIKAHHLKLAERLQYVTQLRQVHELFCKSLKEVFLTEEEDAPLMELDSAYDCIRRVRVLDTSSEGTKALAVAERAYNDHIGALEATVIALMQTQLQKSANSRDMFKVFSKFNVLFVRPTIRGAVIDHQNKLLDMVKKEIQELQIKYRRPYSGSSYEVVGHTRDITNIAGAIQWARQFELRLDSYLDRVQAVLGPEWQSYSDGRKLLDEANLFRAKLGVASMAKEWAERAGNTNLKLSGVVLRAVKRGRDYLQVESTFDPRLLDIQRSSRQMSSMGFDVPRKIWSLSSSVANCIGIVTSIDESLRSLDLVSNYELPTAYQSLLNAAFNHVIEILTNGFHLDWQTFAYGDEKSINFAFELDQRILHLKRLVSTLQFYKVRVEEDLQSMRSCPKQLIHVHIESLQQIVDRLGSYSNVDGFVDDLNRQIVSILIERCKEDLRSWNESKALHQRTHYLRIHKVIDADPPLNESRANFVGFIHSLITYYGQLTSLGIRQRLSFSKFPLEETLSKELNSAYDLLDSQLSQARDCVQEWAQFQTLWDLEVNSVVDRLGSELSPWIDVLRDIQRSRTVMEQEEVRDFGLIRVDCSPLYGQMELKYDMWQNELIKQFAWRWVEHLDQLCSEFSHKRIHLESCELQSISISSMAELLTVLVECERNSASWEQRVRECRGGQAILKAYRYSVSASWTQIEQLDGEWSALQEIMERKRQKIESNRHALTAQILTERETIALRLRYAQDIWQQHKLRESKDPNTALSELEEFKMQANEINEGDQTLQKAADLLNVQIEHIQVADLMQEIDDYISVWTNVKTVWNKLEECRATSWADIAPRKIRQHLDECLAMTRGMPPNIRQYSAVRQTQKLIDDLLQSNNLLLDLTKDYMKERHWKRIFIACNRPFVRQRSLKLGDVWDLNLLINSVHVKQVIDIARGEFVLEEFLNQVKDRWSIFTVDLIDFKATSLIKNWDELFQSYDEHSSALQGMHNSPYFREFEDDCLSWETKLDRVKKLFDVWVEVQRQWVYLEALFDDSNGEIKRILPQESVAFHSISHTLLTIQRTVAKRFLVIEIINMADIQETMERLHDGLNRVQKSLGDYLERERQKFARLYFVGDDDLLEMIGNGGNVGLTQKHLAKMFAGVSALHYDENEITAVISKEGEVMTLQTPVNACGKAVDWLAKLECELRATLADETRFLVSYLRQNMFNEWLVSTHTCQAKSLALEVVWAEQVEQHFDDLSELMVTYDAWLGNLANRVLEDLTEIERRTTESLITELVHLRGCLEELRAEDAAAAKFTWQKRFKYKLVDGELQINQAHATFSYGYEYNGLPDRLVTTKLVDDCFLTMTHALNQNLGGSPFGPAGTGKTETIKALGQRMGKFVVVFCCDEQFDYQALGRILAGLCEIGAWGCFDEFNRLDAKILSAVASQVEAVENGIGSTIDLAGRQVHVNKTTGMFITMNPGYAGRNLLPQNLRRLFRSFSMARPDKEVIAEVVLFSQGFQTAQDLARKVVPLFDHFADQFSTQTHYDFGLRALKNVLKMSGILKRTVKKEEHLLLVQAIYETVLPKLIHEDSEKMDSAIAAIFDCKFVPGKGDKIWDSIKRQAERAGLLPSDAWMNKAMQIYRFQEIHLGIMLVGPAGSGKSSALQTVIRAIDTVNETESAEYVIDAKVMSKEALYGKLDTTTREWTDGVFTSIIRRISENVRGEARKRHWIIFSGDIDPQWVENLNSVLDDNHLLTLPNGERIAIPSNVHIILEVEDVNHTTPATISRCGMIWFGNILSAQMLVHHEMGRRLLNDELEPGVKVYYTCLREILETMDLDAVLTKASACKHVMSFDAMRSLSTVFALLRTRRYTALLDYDNVKEYAIKSIMLAMVWAFGGDCELEERKSLADYIASMFGKEINLLDVNLNPDGSLTTWQVREVDLPTHAVLQPDVIVPTIDTARHEALLFNFLEERKPLILCGPPGSGKTMTLLSALRRSGNIDLVSLNFSKLTDAKLLLKTLEQYCSYRQVRGEHILAAPQMGRWVVVFCDEINLPARDAFGTQQVIALLRQLLEYNGFWKANTWVRLERVQFVGACNPPTDPGRTTLSDRFLRHCAVVHVGYPGHEALHQIYGSLNNALMKCVPSLRQYSQELTNAMVTVYEQESRKSNKTPFYTYSPRELTRWCRGMYEMLAPLEDLSIEEFVRFWAHEATRLFQDRLMTEAERSWSSELLKQTIKSVFKLDPASCLRGPLLYSNWLSRIYGPVDQEQLRSSMKERLRTFGEEEVQVDNLVLYDELLDHALRIDRVLRQIQGHMVLIGASGSGKRTLTRFVAWMNGLNVVQLHTFRGYGEEHFAADLRLIIKRCMSEKICFVVDDSNILETSFLERLNTLLANGEVPGLFEGDELTLLMNACRENVGMNESPDELYRWFVGRVVRNLHVVFTMSPPDDLTHAVSASPALFNRCVVDWMGTWNQQALVQCAREWTRGLSLDINFTAPDTAVTYSTERSFREIVIATAVGMHKEDSPALFLQFIQLFTKIYRHKEELMEEEQRHLNVGVDKMRETVVQVRQLKTELAEKKAILQQQQQEAESMLRKVLDDQNENERQKAMSVTIQHALDEKNREIQARSENVSQELAQVEPMVREARSKVSEIKKSQLVELRSMMNPPVSVKLTLESVCVLLGHYSVASWKDVQAIVRRDDFMSSILNYDCDLMTISTLRKLQSEYLSNAQYDYDAVNRASTACSPLLRWVQAQVGYKGALQKTEPLRRQLHAIENERAESEAQMIAIESMIKELELVIEENKNAYANLIAKNEGLKGDLDSAETRVANAERLVAKLSEEKSRWSASGKEFDLRRGKLVGNCLLAAGSVAYFGRLSHLERSIRLRKWNQLLVDQGIDANSSVTKSPTSYLSSEKAVIRWHELGVPQDPTWVENIVCMTRSSSQKFIVDPTDRMIPILQNLYDNKLVVTSFLDRSFVKHVETAVRFGGAVLVQDAEHLDPVVMNLLSKETRSTGGRTLITIGKNEVDYNNEFKLFLHTRDPGVFIRPDVASRTCVVNFTESRASIESQLLQKVLQSQKPEVESRRRELVRTQGEYRVRLRQLETDLLDALNDSRSTSMLDNNEMIEKLELVKKEAEDIKAKSLEAEALVSTLEVVMDECRPVAYHGGELYNIVEHLTTLNSLYQFSVRFFLDILDAVLRNSKDHSPTALVDLLYNEVYLRCGPALESKHKQVFEAVLLQAWGRPRDLENLKWPSEIPDSYIREICVNQVQHTMPVILHAKDVDPTMSILSFHEARVIAMGAKEGATLADKAIEQCSRRGEWIILQNVHMASQWLEGLETKMRNLHDVAPQFRLFLTINGAEIPTPLLRISRVLTFERPSGVRSSLQSLFVANERCAVASSPSEKPKIYFITAWIHSVIQERLRYLPIGWSKPYEFNDSDYDFALDTAEACILRAAGKRSNISPEDIPWDALQYLLAVCVYGGKIDKQEDSQRLSEIVKKNLNPGLFDNFSLIDGLAPLPDGSSHAELAQWIKDLPDLNSEPSSWLGLPDGAEHEVGELRLKELQIEVLNFSARVFRN